jgi:protocatechuate 3,4-dioxygenase beta subunit
MAHVRRFDLPVVALQRVAAVLHFFNPALWVANRIIHQLREYACDDLALVLSRATPVDSGEAFVQVLRHVQGAPRGLDGALGFFGLDSRACCLRRVHRLLDADRPIRTAPGGRWAAAFLVLAAVTVPHLRAADDPPKAGTPTAKPAARQENAQADAAKRPADEAREFDLRVVDPDGRPVPEAEVEIVSEPVLTAEDIRRGVFVRQRKRWVVLKADAEGRLVVGLARNPDRFNLSVTMPGYGSYWAGWTADVHNEEVPTSFTAELDAAWTVGGVVVDGEGKPVEGATVWPNIKFKKRSGDSQGFYIGAQMKTDASGRWHFDSVPVSMGEVHVSVEHPKFMAFRQHLSRREYEVERGREPAGRIVLQPGVTVTGKVTDEAGRPIAGATVRTKYMNVIRQGTTAEDGVYRLVGCEPKAVRIVASAKGRAMELKEVSIDPDMGPLDFALKPGGTVRIRVVDEKGQPVPKFRVFFQRWRGPIDYFEFDHVNRDADENGVWVWHEAPADELQADINPPKGMSLRLQPLIAREQEYIFRVSRPLVISGKVVDAVSSNPVKPFRVVPGRRGQQGRVIWDLQDAYTSSDGRFQIRERGGEFAHLVRVEADGYHSAVSRDIKSDEGEVSIDFALKPGADVVAKVVTPDVKPAVGAKVALGIFGSQISVRNGDLEDLSTHCERVTTDTTGRFHFPGQGTDFQLVITHPSGFAHIRSSPDWDRARVIRLEPWARVEGTFRVGDKPAANVPITLNSQGLLSYGDDQPSVFTRHDATTGPDGRFAFERVLPGKGQIGREITWLVKEGATEVTSTGMYLAEFPSGQTTRVDLGGRGRPVVGTLRPPAGFDGPVRWNFATVWVSPEGREAQARGPALNYLRASVDLAGRFRIDDVPPGAYSLRVDFQRDEAGRLLNHRILVPPPGNGSLGTPFDLGVLNLQKR